MWVLGLVSRSGVTGYPILFFKKYTEVIFMVALKTHSLTVQFLKPQKASVWIRRNRIGMIESICFVFWTNLAQNMNQFQKSKPVNLYMSCLSYQFQKTNTDYFPFCPMKLSLLLQIITKLLCSKLFFSKSFLIIVSVSRDSILR